MAALRNDYAVHTAEASKRKTKRRRPGRPTLPDEQRRKYSVRIGMTEAEYVALQEWMKAQSLDDEAVALRKMFLDRLKVDGTLVTE